MEDKKVSETIKFTILKFIKEYIAMCDLEIIITDAEYRSLKQAEA